MHIGSSLPSFYIPFIYALIYCIGVSLREPFLNDSVDIHGLLLLFCAVWLLSFYSLASDIVAAAAKSLQLCLTLCDPIDSSPPGSPVPGILQARTLEWVAISFSNA